MDIEIVTRAERPELGPSIWAMPDSWPTFMNHDPIAVSMYGVATAPYPELTVVAVDASATVVAHGQATAFCRAIDGRDEFPDTGWDQSLMWACADIRNGVEPDVASALAITVHPQWQGRGLSARMLGALRNAARARGFDTLIAPVRPSQKQVEPRTPMAEYVQRVREDGLPHDSWLRTHVRAGGVIVKIAPASMVVGAPLGQWREWTGLPFDVDEAIDVPHALTPVHCVPSQGYAVYVEPNVWVRHDLTTKASRSTGQ